MYRMRNTMYRMLTVAVLAILLAANVPFVEGSGLFSACSPCEQVFCDPCEPVCKKGSLFDKFTVYGWLQAGITVNNHGSRNTYNGQTTPVDRNLDVFSGNTYLFMSKHQSDFSVYQAWLGIVKGADTSRGFDWGFQADVLFGTDARYGQCFGDQTFDHGWGTGDYNTSIVQMFATVGYRDVKVRVGKFASGMCHEALPAVATFFHSFAFNCYNTVLHASGVMVDYSVCKNLTVSGGWLAGQMNSFSNRFDDSGFLGNVTFAPSDRLKLAYNLYFGRKYGLGEMTERFGVDRAHHTGSEVIQSLVVTVNLSKKWMYMIESVFVDNCYNNNGPAAWQSKQSYTGINQHWIYTINKKWAVGVRAEWAHGKNSLFDPFGNGYDAYALTLGANWTPNKWLILRPELRYDWSQYKDIPFSGPFANLTKANQLSGGGSVIVKF